MMTTLSADSTRHAKAVAANMAIALAGLFIALIVVLHAVRPELEPSGHMLSEYALGSLGWLMTSAFYALAASYVGLLILVRSQSCGITGYIGMFFLFLAAIGAAMGGLFPMDPLNTPADQATRSAQLHGVGALLGIPGLLIAATLINWSLSRQPPWRASRGLLRWTTIVLWLTFIAIAVSMVLLISGTVGGNLVVGWQNRWMMVTHVGWVILLARRFQQLEA